MSGMNRLANARNEFQGQAKRVLCVCSAGLLRSPTAARVLAEKFGHNTRSAGIEPNFSLIQVDKVLLFWADEIVCMTSEQESEIREMLDNEGYNKEVICLRIADDYSYMDPDLVNIITSRYKEKTQI